MKNCNIAYMKSKKESLRFHIKAIIRDASSITPQVLTEAKNLLGIPNVSTQNLTKDFIRKCYIEQYDKYHEDKAGINARYQSILKKLPSVRIILNAVCDHSESRV